jgi:hypothetical protein
MLKQATKSFTATVMPAHTPVVKAMPEVSEVPNKQRLTKGSATESNFFLKGRPRNSGNRGVTQPTRHEQQTPNNKPKDKK